MQSTSSPTAPHLPTPNLSHLSSGQDYANVYEPAEDSFLLLDVLEADQTLLLETVRPQLCLEVGSGSGVVSTFLAGQVLRTDSPPTDYNGTATLYVATDINPDAARATRKTWLQNGLPDHSLQLVNTQFTEGFHPRFCGTFDVVVFNPPYVVTDPAEVGSHSIAAAWAGGIDGREVIDQFLPMIPVSC
ncbi:S-adenosylmethionine-dependent methyltransferase [Tieghemiomyces parasiticus]|uniref:S-adenosylmethionine-dependent methyltransferase n=1 Tax=Tieghemiomyces parasiticus TaxID=78921 RepID=A0A9W7ZYC3_9FUNG|nr:S-adenosylmethionine-dependent methyltransferase [Tieghemiomyces parasiticus]